jgi:hypothetical protein
MGCKEGDDANGDPFARSLTPQTARKASARMGCNKIARAASRSSAS